MRFWKLSFIALAAAVVAGLGASAFTPTEPPLPATQDQSPPALPAPVADAPQGPAPSPAQPETPPPGPASLSGAPEIVPVPTPKPEAPAIDLSKRKVTLVKVRKADRKLELLAGEEVIRSYPMSLGGNPVGHKQQEGDRRTPEGRYTLDWRNPNSLYYRSIHISYPNAADKAAARKRGVSPGGDIMIHAQPNGWPRSPMAGRPAQLAYRATGRLAALP